MLNKIDIMKSTQRSASYPSYTIPYCLDICTQIYKNYGTNYRATREELSNILGISVGNLTQKVSAAVQYGLLDLKSKEGYKVDDLFVRWYRPLDEEQKNSSLIEAFKSPTLYINLIESFEGSIMPPLKPLSNILLQKHSISERACEKAASIFLENAEELGLFDKDNRLTFNGADNDDGYSEEEIEELVSGNVVLHEEQQPRSNTNSSSDKKFINQEGVLIPILLKDRRTAQLGLPHDAKSEDLDTIINWIRLMKESF